MSSDPGDLGDVTANPRGELVEADFGGWISGPSLDELRPVSDLPIDRSFDELADKISDENRGWKARWDLLGWTAVRESDGKVIRATSPVALQALIGVYFD